MAHPPHKEQHIYIFKVTVGSYFRRNPPSRTLALLKSSTLYTLACTILRAFNFDSDHLFGFYDNVDKWTDSEEVYEFSFEESDVFPGVTPAKNVKKVRISEVFDEIGKEMLFLYDYGDEWHFLVELTEKEFRKEDQKYPAVLEREGKALQYDWSSDPEEIEDFHDECQKTLDELPDIYKRNHSSKCQKTLDELSDLHNN